MDKYISGAPNWPFLVKNMSAADYRFLEHGEYDKQMYGTSTTSIKSILSSGKVNFQFKYQNFSKSDYGITFIIDLENEISMMSTYLFEIFDKPYQAILYHFVNRFVC